MGKATKATSKNKFSLRKIFNIKVILLGLLWLYYKIANGFLIVMLGVVSFTNPVTTNEWKLFYGLICGLFIVSTIVNVSLMIRRRFTNAIKLTFAVELPLILVLLLWIMITTPSLAQIFVFLMIFIAGITYALELLDLKIFIRSKIWNIWLALAKSLQVIMSGYVLIIGLYTYFKIGIASISEVFNFSFIYLQFDLFLIALSPVYVFIIYLIDWNKKYRFRKKPLLFLIIFALLVFIGLTIADFRVVKNHFIERIDTIQELDSVVNSIESEQEMLSEFYNFEVLAKKSFDDLILQNQRYPLNNFASVYSDSQSENIENAPILFNLFNYKYKNSDRNLSGTYYKIYDQEYERKDIFVNTLFSSRRSGDEEFVHLKEMNFESEINEDVALHETTIELLLDNVTSSHDEVSVSRAEVIIDFNLPQEAVVTDLKLGLNLENQGQIAPIGAATETYNRQVFRGKDPALLTKISPNTYSLKVFPIFRDIDQKVSFTYVSPVDNELTAYPVFFKTDNLFVNSDTKIRGEVISDDYSSIKVELLSDEKAVNYTGHSKWNLTSNIDEYFKGEKSLTLMPNSQSFRKACKVMSGKGFRTNNRVSEINVIFDISRSAVDKEIDYMEILSQIEEIYPPAQYKYKYHLVNHRVQSFSDKKSMLDKFNFWGANDYETLSNLLTNISKNTKDGEFSRSIIIKDTQNTEYSEFLSNMPNTSYQHDYSVFKNNTVDLIITGDFVPGMVDKITNSVLSSGGKSFNIKDTNKFNVKYLRECDLSSIRSENVDDDWVKKVDQLKALDKGNDMLAEVDSTQKRQQIGFELNKLSRDTKVLLPLNAYIALETREQEELLEQLSQNEDAYDEVGIENQNAVNTISVRSMPAAKMKYLFPILLLIFIIRFTIKPYFSNKKIEVL